MPCLLKITKNSAPFALALILAPFFFTHAQTPEIAPVSGLQSELSRLTESLDLLTAMKAGKRPMDAISLQTALNDVLNLSDEEVRNVSIRIAAQDKLTDKEITLRDELITSLADLKIHIQSVRIGTTQEAGATSVIWLANTFKEWREGPYAKTMEHATAFADALENDDSIKGAALRLAAILKDEKKIRAVLPTSKTGVFLRLIKKAQGEIRQASELNTKVKAALMPDEDDEVATDDATASEMAHESSELINAAYDAFIAISKLVRK